MFLISNLVANAMEQHEYQKEQLKVCLHEGLFNDRYQQIRNCLPISERCLWFDNIGL